MDTTELSGLLKRLCKVAWAANVTNPITYVTQISYLLFLKMLEEWDAQAEQDARDLSREHQSLFETIEVNGEPIEYGALRWSRFSTDPDNDRMLRTVRDLLPRLAEHPQLSQGARQIFVGAALVIPDGASLRRMVDLISPVSFMAEDADVKGDLFEILVDDLGSQKRAAQFRTPRHLIRVITAMVDPQNRRDDGRSGSGHGGLWHRRFRAHPHRQFQPRIYPRDAAQRRADRAARPRRSAQAQAAPVSGQRHDPFV